MPTLDEVIWLLTGVHPEEQPTAPPTTETGGSTGEGVATSQATSSSGSNIYVRLYLRQGKSSTAGKVKIQIRAYFYYAPYESNPTATLRVFKNNNTSGTPLLFELWGWHRQGVGFHAIYSDWYDLPEQDNVESLSFYALCSPADGYPEVGYYLSIQNVRPSYTLTIAPDDNIQSYTYSIQDYSGVYGSSRENQTAKTAIVYYGDRIKYTAIPKSGYKVQAQEGTTPITKNTTINIKALAQATIHLFTAGAWHLYSIYIRRGGAWVQHQANIRKAGSWQQYS